MQVCVTAIERGSRSRPNTPLDIFHWSLITNSNKLDFSAIWSALPQKKPSTVIPAKSEIVCVGDRNTSYHEWAGVWKLPDVDVDWWMTALGVSQPHHERNCIGSHVRKARQARKACRSAYVPSRAISHPPPWARLLLQYAVGSTHSTLPTISKTHRLTTWEHTTWQNVSHQLEHEVNTASTFATNIQRP